jgi:hypothetical protein
MNQSRKPEISVPGSDFSSCNGVNPNKQESPAQFLVGKSSPKAEEGTWLSLCAESAGNSFTIEVSSRLEGNLASDQDHLKSNSDLPPVSSANPPEAQWAG